MTWLVVVRSKGLARFGPQALSSLRMLNRLNTTPANHVGSRHLTRGHPLPSFRSVTVLRTPPGCQRRTLPLRPGVSAVYVQGRK
jgi:hypothetical protein